MGFASGYKPQDSPWAAESPGLSPSWFVVKKVCVPYMMHEGITPQEYQAFNQNLSQHMLRQWDRPVPHRPGHV